MLKLYIKIWKLYGFWHIVKNFTAYFKVFNGLQVMAEKFNVLKEWNQFKSHTNVGKNFTYLNLMQLKYQLESQKGINYQKKLRFLTKV